MYFDRHGNLVRSFASPNNFSLGGLCQFLGGRSLYSRMSCSVCEVASLGAERTAELLDSRGDVHCVVGLMF